MFWIATSHESCMVHMVGGDKGGRLDMTWTHLQPPSQRFTGNLMNTWFMSKNVQHTVNLQSPTSPSVHPLALPHTLVLMSALAAQDKKKSSKIEGGHVVLPQLVR
jgi:hypothetical protein